MSFKIKLIITYTILAVLLASISAFIFISQATQINESNAKFEMEIDCKSMSQQLDELIRPMEFISLNLLSNYDTWFAANTLSSANRNTQNGIKYVNGAKSDLLDAISTYDIYKNFKRVSFFNEKGDFITSEYLTLSKSYYTKNGYNQKYIKIANEQLGKPIITPSGKDVWALSEPKEVFSLLRYIRGFDTKTYIEVQRSRGDLQRVFEVQPTTYNNIIAFTDYNEVFYTTLKEKSEIDYFTTLVMALPEDTVSTINDPQNNEDVLVAQYKSNYSGIKIFLIKDIEIVKKNTEAVFRMVLIMVTTMIALSIIYIYLMTNRLTKPIKKLYKQIESTTLSNLKEDRSYEKSYDEITTLNKAYSDLLKRIDDSVIMQNKLTVLNMQANFDSMQASMNPHFLYNVLNIISNRGIESKDEEVCKICDCLAAMLRYSSNTKSRTATIFDEVANVENFIYLLKQRYEHKLEYYADFDANMNNLIVPKIILQPFVENSINHGFENGNKIMKIYLKGYIKEEWMYIEIEDNGNGFSNDDLKTINEKIIIAKQDIITNYHKPDEEIGGLGVLNIFIRMYLFFKDDFEIIIGNTENGAKITIKIRFRR